MANKNLRIKEYLDRDIKENQISKYSSNINNNNNFMVTKDRLTKPFNGGVKTRKSSIIIKREAFQKIDLNEETTNNYVGLENKISIKKSSQILSCSKQIQKTTENNKMNSAFLRQSSKKQAPEKLFKSVFRNKSKNELKNSKHVEPVPISFQESKIEVNLSPDLLMNEELEGSCSDHFYQSPFLVKNFDTDTPQKILYRMKMFD
ncbi:hypothetical protein HZS_2338 [Henneguya salminicola]|nr:hypothetical protein HZS_2338 [Henneguya salminicola]